MRELPCLMNGHGVRATLAGIKTMTRRPITRHAPEWAYSAFMSDPNYTGHWRVQTDKHSFMSWLGGTPDEQLERAKHFCKGWNPLGVPGDLLYVRETFCVMQDIEACALAGESIDVVYRADEGWADLDKWELEGVGVKWRPSIHMPKWAARLWLVNTGVRVERVQDITEEDVIAEGVRQIWEDDREYFESDAGRSTCPFEAYAWLWDSIYIKRGLGWDMNPFLFVTSYEVTEP